jgi:hypothetical protein
MQFGRALVVPYVLTFDVPDLLGIAAGQVWSIATVAQKLLFLDQTSCKGHMPRYAERRQLTDDLRSVKSSQACLASPYFHARFD